MNANVTNLMVENKPAYYRVENLVMNYGGYVALNGISIGLAKGELLVLLGPSGCGKSTAMRCISGLEKPSGGRITFGDRVIFDAERRIDLVPEKRDVGMVFQSYALWPHKTVRDNIAYPLQVRGMKSALAEGWVETAARMVDCEQYLDRYPGQLSGGQQQRVALARGIVSRPDMVMFDEPLSNLDALLREKVRGDLAALHRKLGFAGIYVTHDQSEAFAIGDRVAVMHRGGISQLGTPQEIFERPANEYVANFVGMTNVIPPEGDGQGWKGPSAEELSALGVPAAVGTGNLRYRTQSARLSTDSGMAVQAGQILRFRATFEDAIYAGGEYEARLSLGGNFVYCRVSNGQMALLSAGQAVELEIPLARSAVFRSSDQGLISGGTL